MADNSDTESDSAGSVLVNAAEDILSPSTFTASPDSSQPGTISQIIETLLCQPLTCSVRHEEIEAASSSLIRFVDDIPCRLKNDVDVPEVLTTFALLVKPIFLNKLFEYRLFYQDAASQTNAAKSLYSTLVTWVDVLLASLSFATVVIAATAEAVEFLDQGLSETIRLQKRYDSIRAATQLPDKWHKLASVVGSSNSSPAAKRIVLCLLFAVCVIGPQLDVTKSDPWAHESPLPADVLTNMYLGARHLFAPNPLLLGFPSTIQERINAALLISLFAMADNEVKSCNLAGIGSSNLRPDGYGYLLELIRIIIANEDIAAHTPPESLDVPQTILLRWGSAVPWSWSTWDDLRVANTEYLRVVTTTWLYHLNSPFFAGLDHALHRRIFGIDFRAILFRDYGASTGMVSNLLQHDLRSISFSFESGEQSPLATRRVLVKTCWAVVQFLEANVICPDPVIERHIPEYTRCILSLFLFLGISEEENFVKSLIIEALTMIQLSIFRTELQMILREDSGQFLPRLEEATRRTLSHISGSRDENDHGVEAGKHLLGFLTLLLHTEAKNGTLQGIVSSYLSALVRLLKLQGPDSFQSQVLQDSLLVSLSVFMTNVTTRPLSENHYDSLWNLTSLSKKRNMIASSTFAQYLLASDQLCDPLTCHESWDVFRDMLTAIINHDLKEDEEEHLALLISPILCRGLAKLISSSQVSTRNCLICSPWTTNLRLALSKLLDISIGISTFPYLETLQNRLEHAGKLLLNEVGHASWYSASLILGRSPKDLKRAV